mgnify:FL=1
MAQTAFPGCNEPHPWYEEMFRRNPAPKLLIDAETGAIVDANPAALDFYGYSLERIRELAIEDINTLSADEVRAEREKARREERRYFEFQHRLASGEVRDVKVYTGPVEMEGRQYLHSIIHDVTDHARHHERQVAEALRRILTELVYEAPTPGLLFERVCRIVTEEAGFRLAWIGRVDEAGWLRPEAWHGDATDYLEGLILSRDAERPEGEGPGGQSLRMGEPRVFQDLEREPSMAYWRERARSLGLKGVAALPFREGGRVTGALLVYAPEPDYFTEDIIDLLRQAAHAIGFALESYHHDQERQRTEQELSDSEQRYRSIITAMAEGVALHGPDGAIVAVNPAAQRILGLSEAQILGRDSMDPGWRAITEDGRDFPGEQHPAMVSLHTGQEVRGRVMGIEDPRRGTRWISINSEPLRDETGTVGAVATFADITEQRETERSRDQLVRILEATPDFVSIAEPDGTVLYVNEGGRRLLGLPPTQGELGDSIPREIREHETAGKWGHPPWAAAIINREGIPAAMERGYWEGETALVDVHGREIPVSQVILAHRDERGEVTRMSTIMRDISQQKELQQALEQRQQTLRRLQDITGDPGQGLEEKLAGILRLGAEIFGLPYGILSHVEGEDYWIRQATSPDDSLAAGQHFELGLTYCTHTLAANGPVGFYRASESTIREHPCFRTRQLEAYLGVPVRVGTEIYGTLNFSRPEAREPYSDFEWELLKLMGQWASYELTREANRHALERERNLFIGGPTVVFQWQPDGAHTITYVSPNVADNLGYRPEELRGRPYLELVHPADRERMAEEWRHMARAEQASHEQEYRLLTRDGRERWVQDFTVADRDEEGTLASYQGYLLDITARRELEADQRLLATAFHTSQALLITDADGRIERVNPAFTAITGYSPEEAIGANPRILASGIHDKAFYAELWRQLEAVGHWEGEIWNRRKNGEIYPEWESISAVLDEKGRVEHYVAVSHDISEQKRLEAELERMATHDRLTGIFNRAKLYELLETAREEYERYGTPFSVIMFDIDHFKLVNDTYGHSAGDGVLRELTQRVQSTLRETDHFGRWGGEEFLILTGHVDRAGALHLAERIREVVADRPFRVAGTVTVSLGVAEFREGESLEHLEERADEALYTAKRNGRNQARVAREDAAGQE